MRPYVQRPDSQLHRPRGFDFLPGTGLDCNANGQPDSCDIAAGRSQDRNANGVPDECEPCRGDLDRDGRLAVQDFLIFLDLFAAGDLRVDFDLDGRIGVRDFLSFLDAYAEGCG
jgi:hypothetical protein